MKKILVGILAYDRKVDCDLMKTLLLIERTNKYHLDYLFPISSHLARNRNYVVAEALKSDYDGVLFLDADMSIPDETFLDKMIETGYRLDAKIICGAYLMKKPDNEVVYIAATKDGDKKPDNIRKIPPKPQLIWAGGTGCMLIYREVFTKIEEPYFSIIDGKNLEVLPEDFYACEKAQKAGFKIALDPRFETRHWGMKSWTHIPIDKT